MWLPLVSLIFCCFAAADVEVFVPVGDALLVDLDPTYVGLGTIISTAGVGQAGDLVRVDRSKCSEVIIGQHLYHSLKSTAVLGKVSPTTSSDIPYELSEPVRTFTASGYLIDCDTSYIAGAVLTAEGVNTTTDKNGRFSFQIPANGQLTIVKDGYATQAYHYRAPAGLTVAWAFVLFSPEKVAGNRAAAAITWDKASDTDLYVVTPTMTSVYYGRKNADGAHFLSDRSGVGGPECVFIDDVTTGTWRLWADIDDANMGMHYTFQTGVAAFAVHSTGFSAQQMSSSNDNWHGLDYDGKTSLATVFDAAVHDSVAPSG